METCTKCKVAKPATMEFFPRATRNSSGFSSWCRACHSATCVARAKANPEKVKALSAAWRQANPEKVKARSAAWNKANPEKVKALSAARYKANPEKVKAYACAWKKANPEKARASSAAWQKANPARVAAHSRKRDAAKLQAVPKWYDEKKVQAIYAKAAAKTKSTGIPHVVDHVCPLQSKLVCGLHWSGNLRVITAEKNMAKGNRTWPGMP